MVTACLADDLAAVSRRGVIVPRRDGDTALQLTLAGQTISVPVSVRGSAAPFRPDFIRDIAPIIAKMGCNQGTCHGAAKGKNGFKLSLRGYDADRRSACFDRRSRVAPRQCRFARKQPDVAQGNRHGPACGRPADQGR